MSFEEWETVSSSCLDPSPQEDIAGTAGQQHPTLAGSVQPPDPEVPDFIMSHVLEQDAQFFDG